MAPHVKIKKLHPDAIIPTYAKPGDSCADLCAVERTEWENLYATEVIKQTDLPMTRTEYRKNIIGKFAIVKTGLAFELPEGYELQVRPRSGNAGKFKVSILNTPGTLDNKYRGEAMVILYSIGDPQGDYKDCIPKGAKVAQAAFMPIEQATFEIVDELSVTERGEGRLNSSGTLTK